MRRGTATAPWRLDATAQPARRRTPRKRTLRHPATGRRRTAATASSERHAPMLVAVTSFTTTYMGQPVLIQAGRDYVRANHAIVQQHPHAFRPDVGRLA